MDIINEQFNNTFLQFLSELERIFPDSPARKTRIQFNLSKLVNNKPPITIFCENIQGHGDAIMSKAEDYFFKMDLEFVEYLELEKYYKMSNKETRDIIWQYIQTLYYLSSSYHKNC